MRPPGGERTSIEAATCESSSRSALERSDHTTFDVDELRDMIIHKNRGDRRAEYVLITLEKLGVVEQGVRAGQYSFVRPLRDDEIDAGELERKKRADLQRLLDMVHLARSDDQRQAILDYFQLDEGSRT